MEQERPYTETEPETAAETAETVTETVTETAETAAEAAAPKKLREPFFRRQRASFPTPGARSTATAARGTSARGRSRCSHC